MTIYVGTAGWSYPRGGGKWDGIFYPETLSEKEKLAYYAQFFNAVEVNSTFYRPVAPGVAESWVERTPPGFRFTAKLWQKFSHPKMFEEATGREARVSEEDFEVFSAGLMPLLEAGKLGPVVAQFPPSFKPDDGSIDYLEDLIRRLRASGFTMAVELRHRAWTDSEQAEAARRLMEDENVAWVMIDEPRFHTSIRHVPLTSRVGYFRFHGRNYKEWWHHENAEDRYNHYYSLEEQQELADQVLQVAQQTKETHVFYNNHYSAKAVVNALQLKLVLGEDVPAEKLPDPLLTTYRDLSDLLRERSTV
jgi:uncharacterized protein YecE (DUF72 family)